jgi:membrane-bound inhibitor of C-type lysozyme
MTTIVLISSLELELEVLQKSKQWPNICSYLMAQITYFQNEEVTYWPSANELELGMQMACQVESTVMLQNNKKIKSKQVRSTCGVFGLASILKIRSN